MCSAGTCIDAYSFTSSRELMAKYKVLFFIFLLFFSHQILVTQKGYSFTKITFLTKSFTGPDEGHSGVVSSLRRGLEPLSIQYNFNPHTVDEVGDVVVVLASKAAFYQALAWKESGRIKALLAGPNVSIDDPEEFFRFISCLDCYLTPASWCRNAYVARWPHLEKKIKIWFSGVDTGFFSPKNEAQKKNKKILIYCKSSPQAVCDAVEKIALTYGWNPQRLQYGSYTHMQYKEVLEQSDCAVFLSPTESQGLALAECWAMNVPTLVWNLEKELVYLGIRYDTTSACPYLNVAAGRDWKTESDFEKLLSTFDSNDFSPRIWVQNNMTDRLSVELLLTIVQQYFDIKRFYIGEY